MYLAQIHTITQPSNYRMLPSVNTFNATDTDSFQCAVELCYRRNYFDLFEGCDVYLPGTDELIVRLKPAIGERYRNPTKFVAIVVSPGAKPRMFRTVEIRAGQLLRVED